MEQTISKTKLYDCFISHASEDKTDFVEELVSNLESKGIKVWYDAKVLNIGDSLRESIDKGLKDSLCGIVVLSKNFFTKQWTDYELNGLVASQMATGLRTILPVWHNVTAEEVREYSLPLSDILAGNSNSGVETVARSIIKTINNIKNTNEGMNTELDVISKIGEESAISIKRYEENSAEIFKSNEIKNILENLILDDKNIIKINKIINSHMDHLIAVLTEDFSALAKIQDIKHSTFYERALSYDVYCERILTILSVGAYWGSDKYNNLWINIFKRLANFKIMNSGYTTLIKLQKYPSLLIYYMLLLIGVFKEDYLLIYKTFYGFDINDYNDNGSAPVNIYFTEDIIRKDNFNAVLNKSYKTPVNDHIHDVLRPFFNEIIPDDKEFSNIFDRVEYLIGIEFGSNRINTDYGFWAPTGRFLWRFNYHTTDLSYMNKLHPVFYYDKLAQEGDIFKFKLLGENIEQYKKITEEYLSFVNRIHFF